MPNPDHQIKPTIVPAPQKKSPPPALSSPALYAPTPKLGIALDRRGMIIGLDCEAERVFGLYTRNAIGKPLLEVLASAKYGTRQRAKLESFLTTTTPAESECQIQLSAKQDEGSSFSAGLKIVALDLNGRRYFAATVRPAPRPRTSRTLVATERTHVHYQQMAELLPEAILVSRHGALLFANQAATRMLNDRGNGGLAGRRLLDLIDPSFHGSFVESVAGQSATGFLEQVWCRTDGTRVSVETGVSTLVFESGPALQIVVRDISARKRAEALQLGENKILNMIAVGAKLADVMAGIAEFAEKHSSRALCSILQLNCDGTALVEHTAPSLPSSYLNQLGTAHVGPASCSCGTAAFRAEPVMVTDISSDPLWADKRALALEYGLRACTSWPIFGKARKVLGSFALYFRDPVAPSSADLELFRACTNLAGIAIERHASEEKIRHLAHYDGLTGLANRFLFKEYMELALRSAQRKGKKFAVLFLDLDKFKEINDGMGHAAGDQVLCEISARLRSCLRDTDKIARMAGDEFYVLIEDLKDGHHAGEVARKLVAEAARPIQVGVHICQVSASVGIALFPQDGVDGNTLLRNADKAMYDAKEAGRNAFRFHSFPLGCDPAAALTRLFVGHNAVRAEALAP